jgi:hypothetical protein
MKPIANRAIALVLAAICGNLLGMCHYAIAQTPPSYPLYCHGPLHTVMSHDIYGSVDRTHFKWSTEGAGAESPDAGQCAWADRGPRGIEIKPGGGNDMCGGLGQVSNLRSGKYAEIGVFRDPHIDNCMHVTQVVGFVAPPFSPRPVLPSSMPKSSYNCAHCNDGSCQCGNETGAQLCANHSGANPAVGCTQEP